MKSNVLLLALFVSSSLGAGTCLAAETSPGSTAAEKTVSERPRLQPGMTADAVVSVVGRPDAIKIIKTAQGEGERWTYRRVAGRSTTLDPVTIQAVPIFDGAVGPTDDIGTEMAPVFHVKKVVTYQLTALLLVDGKLVMAKQWQERTRDYTD